MNLTIERPSFVDVQDFQARELAATGGKPLFGEAGPSFGDLLDIINPLQHLPLVGTIYRALTGDEMSDGARLAGGALFGGPIGLVAAMANLGLREATGRDLGETALAALTGDEAPAAAAQEAPMQVAGKEPTPAELATLEPAAGPAAESAQPAAAGATPQLSPEAFDALLRSVNQPAQSRAAAPKAATWPAAWSRANPPGAAPVAMPPALRAAAGGLPAINPAALDALAGGPAAAPAMAPGARQAGLELHDALRLYAQQKGLAPNR